MGRTNSLKLALKQIGDKAKIFLIDAANEGLRSQEDKEHIHYASVKEDLTELFEQIEEEIEERKEGYQEEKTLNKQLTLSAYGHALEPVYLLVDVIQNLQDALKEKKDEKRLELLSEASAVGMYVIVTSDPKLRTIGSKFMENLSTLSQGFVVGSIKEQSVFPSLGVRENNQKAEYGYYYGSGKAELLMMAECEEGR